MTRLSRVPVRRGSTPPRRGLPFRWTRRHTRLWLILGAIFVVFRLQGGRWATLVDPFVVLFGFFLILGLMARAVRNGVAHLLGGNPRRPRTDFRRVTTPLRPSPQAAAPADYFQLSPTQFEHRVAAIYRQHGIPDATVVGGAGDLTQDVVGHLLDGRRVIIQCKQWTHPVGSPELQQFVGMGYLEHHADLLIMVGLSGFTEPAHDLARRHHVLLVDGAALARIERAHRE